MLMIIPYLPFLLGTIAVLQAALNKKISITHSLPIAVFLNSSIIFVIASLYLLIAHYFQDQKLSTFQFEFWYFIPALLGFTFVTLTPLAFQNLGATQTFILIVVGQLVTSLIWDLYIEHRPVSTLRYIGVFLTVIGSWLATKN